MCGQLEKWTGRWMKVLIDRRSQESREGREERRERGKEERREGERKGGEEAQAF